MGLTQEQDRRPRDWAYQVAFDRKDLPSLQEMVKHIQDTHDTDMIESFNARCEQKLNTGAAELDSGIEIQAVTKTEDLVVNAGLQQCVNIILGISSTRFRYIAIGGGGGTAATINDIGLVVESGSGRIDTLSLGWNEAVGMKLFFGGVFGEWFVETNYSEYGVFNNASGTTMLNRNCFNGVTRGSRAAVYILSSVVEFCPVA